MSRERLVAFLRDRLVYLKIVTALLWLSWLVSIAMSGFTRDLEGKPIGTDHIAFYSAAKLIDEGRGDKIYDYDFLGSYQPTLVGNTGWCLDGYRNPPFYALFYLPTARLPYLASFWIWTAIALALLWFGLGWLGSEHRLSAFLISMSFYPVFSVFSFGQNSVLSFGIFCATFCLMEKKRFFLAGMAAGLLLFKPQLLLGLGLWWLLSFRRYLWCWLGLAATAAILTAVSFLAVPDETRLFIRELPRIARYDMFMFWNLHNPRGFFTLIAFDDKRVGNVLGGIFSLAAVVYFISFWRKQRGNMPVMFAAAVFLTLWASPHTMIYEWTIAVVPAVLLWDRAKEKRDEWLIIFSIAWIVLLVSTPIAKGLFEWTKNEQSGAGWALQISVPVLGLLGLWAGKVLMKPNEVLRITKSETNDP